jgi:uncharacterized phage-associated protein
MYTALQVANYFIKKAKEENIPLDPMKLQKLLYFAYGWHYANYDKPLFSDQINAWQWGPVVEDIYHAFKKYGKRNITELKSDLDIKTLQTTIPIVPESDTATDQFLRNFWDTYKNYTGPQLSGASHANGSPWKAAYDPNKFFNPINSEKIRDYFKDLKTRIKTNA